MEAFLRACLPRVLDEAVEFNVYPHQCKEDLLARLPQRLKGYARWLPDTWKIVVVVDRDDDDCHDLKRRMDEIAVQAGLEIPARSKTAWHVCNRIAIEELEAWYFGDWDAVRSAFPRVSKTTPSGRRFRNPDKITEGTWEAFECVLKKAGYCQTGLRKIETARAIGKHVDPARSQSPSFRAFWRVIEQLSRRQPPAKPRQCPGPQNTNPDNHAGYRGLFESGKRVSNPRT